CDSTPPSTTRSHGGRGRSCAVPTPRSSSSCVRHCRKQGGCPRRPGTSPGGADRASARTKNPKTRTAPRTVTAHDGAGCPTNTRPRRVDERRDHPSFSIFLVFSGLFCVLVLLPELTNRSVSAGCRATPSRPTVKCSEPHGGRAVEGVMARVDQRALALVAAAGATTRPTDEHCSHVNMETPQGITRPEGLKEGIHECRAS